jgi:hypothetical protein
VLTVADDFEIEPAADRARADLLDEDGHVLLLAHRNALAVDGEHDIALAQPAALGRRSRHDRVDDDAGGVAELPVLGLVAIESLQRDSEPGAPILSLDRRILHQERQRLRVEQQTIGEIAVAAIAGREGRPVLAHRAQHSGQRPASGEHGAADRPLGRQIGDQEGLRVLDGGDDLPALETHHRFQGFGEQADCVHGVADPQLGGALEAQRPDAGRRRLVEPQERDVHELVASHVGGGALAAAFSHAEAVRLRQVDTSTSKPFSITWSGPTTTPTRGRKPPHLAHQARLDDEVRRRRRSW